MEKKALDYILVPLGFLAMVAYHLWLLYRIMNYPNKTVIGTNTIHRSFWVCAMMEVILFLYHDGIYLFFFFSFFFFVAFFVLM